MDGSQVEDVVTDLSYPIGIALDVDEGKVYWVDHSPGTIRRANLDGSQVEDVVSGGLFGMALDVEGGKVYWTDVWGSGRDNGNIRRANLDGSQVESLVTGLGQAQEIALDVTAGKMYWTDIINDKIQRANLDGSQVEDIYEEAAGNGDLYDIALDAAAGKVYLTGFPSIRRANLDGSQVEDLVVGRPAAGGSIALDVTAGKMYWTSPWGFHRANLDGSQVEDLAIEAPSSEGQIALDLSGTTPPAAVSCIEDLGTLTADVSRAGEWISGCASVTKSGKYARFYSFTLGEEREVTIDLTSSEDTVLSLLRGAGTRRPSDYQQRRCGERQHQLPDHPHAGGRKLHHRGRHLRRRRHRQLQP